MDSDFEKPDISSLNNNDLLLMDKEQLIAKIHSMQRHINQLKNIINKYKTKDNSSTNLPRRQFDFSKYETRHILIKFLYLGWNYDGYVVQEDYLNTVENILFQALLKTRLIESREMCNYNRCGRTDKGVSAFSQVISLTVRSKMKKEVNQNEQNLEQNCEDELDYIFILNKVLPPDIRIISWAPVNSLISARFDCKRRTYRYYFPRIDLDIDKMNEACTFLIGEHDFRNLCKIDVSNGVINFKRNVYNASVISSSHDPDSICIFNIEASAFLWHQIRNIMAVLFMVGQNLEEPDVIAHLLDIEKNQLKPQYSMASGFPLVLFDVQYNPDQVPRWIYGKDENTILTLSALHAKWSEKMIQSSIIKSMIDSLKGNLNQNNYTNQKHFIQIRKMFGDQGRHKKLFDRPVCHSLEIKMEKLNKRIKI